MRKMDTDRRRELLDAYRDVTNDYMSKYAGETDEDLNEMMNEACYAICIFLSAFITQTNKEPLDLFEQMIETTKDAILRTEVLKGIKNAN